MLAVLARSVTVGVLHPGEMGAAVGTQIRAAGHTVLWVSEGRSDATAKRAHDAGFDDAGTTHELAGRCEVIVSVCPPHAAVDVARAFASFDGPYVDANAVSPATAREIASIVPRFVDGGIIGPPGGMRIYASPERRSRAAVAGVLGATVVSNASALKMAYAAWTKGTAALILAIWGPRGERKDPRRAAGDEWRCSRSRSSRIGFASGRSDPPRAKGWRWVGEMEEIAATFAADGLPDGFRRAAAEIFRRQG